MTFNFSKTSPGSLGAMFERMKSARIDQLKSLYFGDNLIKIFSGYRTDLFTLSNSLPVNFLKV